MPEEVVGVNEGVAEEVQEATPEVDAQDTQAQVAKLQEDINKLKSTFQRKAHETEQQFRQREAEYQRQLAVYQQQLASLQQRLREQYYASLTPAEREQAELEEARQLAEYYRNIALQTQQQAAQLQALEQARAYRDSMAEWYSQEYGIPKDKLDYSSPEAMQRSAMDWLKDRRTGRRAEPPKVASGVPRRVSKRRSWKELSWEEMEEIFRQGASGKLSKDEIPV